MIETVMVFGLGVFITCLAFVFIDKAVWRRAIQLTTNREQPTLPISPTEIKADREQRHADCAASARKLELASDELKQKMMEQVGEVDEKNEQIRILQLDAESISEELQELKQREEAQKLEIAKLQSELNEMTRKYRGTEKKLNDSQTAMGERDKALKNSQSVIELQRAELAAMNAKLIQLDADHAAKRDALVRAERILAEERAVDKSIAVKLEASERTVQSQAQQIGQLQAKIFELTAQLRTQISETERAVFKAQNLLSERNKIDGELARRMAETEAQLNHALQDNESARSERASLEGQLTAAREERNRLAQDIKLLRANNGNEDFELPPGTIYGPEKTRKQLPA